MENLDYTIMKFFHLLYVSWSSPRQKAFSPFACVSPVAPSPCLSCVLPLFLHLSVLGCVSLGLAILFAPHLLHSPPPSDCISQFTSCSSFHQCAVFKPRLSNHSSPYRSVYQLGAYAMASLCLFFTICFLMFCLLLDYVSRKRIKLIPSACPASLAIGLSTLPFFACPLLIQFPVAISACSSLVTFTIDSIQLSHLSLCSASGSKGKNLL